MLQMFILRHLMLQLWHLIQDAIPSNQLFQTLRQKELFSYCKLCSYLYVYKYACVLRVYLLKLSSSRPVCYVIFRNSAYTAIGGVIQASREEQFNRQRQSSSTSSPTKQIGVLLMMTHARFTLYSGLINEEVLYCDVVDIARRTTIQDIAPSSGF